MSLLKTFNNDNYMIYLTFFYFNFISQLKIYSGEILWKIKK